MSSILLFNKDGFLALIRQEALKANTRLPFFETVLSIHLNLQFQLRSVREVWKDLNKMSSSLSADRVKCEPELIKGSYEQTRECIW